jgi:hypothetical protein
MVTAARSLKNCSCGSKQTNKQTKSTLEQLGWNTLEDRRQQTRLVRMYKIVHLLVVVHHPPTSSMLKAEPEQTTPKNFAPSEVTHLSTKILIFHEQYLNGTAYQMTS